MRQTHRISAVVAAASVLALGCGQPKKDTTSTIPTPTPGPGTRVLSISNLPAHMPNPSTQDFIDAVNQGKSLGQKGNFLSYTWSSLEPTAGQMNVAKVGNDINGSNSAGFSTLYVSIQMINTTAKETPADLQAVAFDDSNMKARFHALVDAIAPSLTGKVAYFGIGNEVDVYLHATNQWTQFQSFFEDGAAYVKSKVPGIQVGTTLTFGGAQAYPANMAALTTNADLMIFTDYPLGAQFKPLDPIHGKDDLDTMVTMAGAKKVLVQEFGYPADAQYLGSSEDAQAAFFSNGMAEWSGIGGAKMPFLNLFLLHDFSTDMCDQFAAYYGDPNDNNFKAYLCSLGLRKVDDTPRKAFDAVKTAAQNTGLLP